MLSRRELLVTSVALPLAAQAPGAVALPAEPFPAAAATRGAIAPASYFVAAAELAEARSAAQAATVGGTEIVWLGRDLTPVYLWLDTALRRARSPIEGLTTSHDFFVIERLAWDRGLRTVRRTPLGAALEWRLEPRTKREIGSDTIFGGVS